MLVSVYVGELNRLFYDTERYERYFKGLSDERKKRTEKIGSFEGRCRSVGAGLMLDEALKKYGFREKDMSIIYGENGKPVFKDAPELFFNLSHSKKRAMCVIGNFPAGCDVEHIHKVNDGIAHRFFTEKDNFILSEAKALGEEEYKKKFYTLWTLKESYIKCTGLGLKCPLDSFAFSYDGIRYQIDDKPEYVFSTFTGEDLNSICETVESNDDEIYVYSVCLKSGEIFNLSVNYFVL